MNHNISIIDQTKESAGTEGSGEGTAVRQRFQISDPLGICMDDVASLNHMPEQKLLEMGFIDITSAPFLADPTGRSDSTRAIQDAVFFGRHHKFAVYFPLGEYLVSNTVECRAGWSDERTPEHKYLPYTESWPCVLIGERRDSKRPVVKLAPYSPGFDETGKSVFDFDSRDWKRKSPMSPLGDRQGATGYNQLLYGIDVEIGPGNPGAAAVSFNQAEGSSIQDCEFRIGSGYAGISGGPGSGGALFNISFIGGRVGAAIIMDRPVVVLVGCHFREQRESAVLYSQRGPLILIGCKFWPCPGASILKTQKAYMGKNNSCVVNGASIVDCRIEYESFQPTNKVIEPESPIYIRNTWVRNAAVLLSNNSIDLKAADCSGWTLINELACPFEIPERTVTCPIYIGGRKYESFYQCIEAVSGEPPEDLCSRHVLWDNRSFPQWNNPSVVNVRQAPYNVKGDGLFDDTDALQKAINENEVIFLPKGAYRITRTLNLKPDTKIIGISPAYCMIVPSNDASGYFADFDNPRPVIKTDNTADAETVLAFFSIFMPREDAPAAYMLDWNCGGVSYTRAVFPVTGYTENDLLPLRKGIRPWTNWRWEDIIPLSEYAGSVIHYDPDQFGADSTENGIPNWPLVKVHHCGSGAFYQFVALDGRQHGKQRRRILIENIRGPFAVYVTHLQYCTGEYELEIANSCDVSIVGIKNEKKSTAVCVQDSKNISILGIGGVGIPGTDPVKFLLKNSEKVTLTTLFLDSPNPRRQSEGPMIKTVFADNLEFCTIPYEYPTLFKV